MTNARPVPFNFQDPRSEQDRNCNSIVPSLRVPLRQREKGIE